MEQAVPIRDWAHTQIWLPNVHHSPGQHRHLWGLLETGKTWHVGKYGNFYIFINNETLHISFIEIIPFIELEMDKDGVNLLQFYYVLICMCSSAVVNNSVYGDLTLCGGLL